MDFSLMLKMRDLARHNSAPTAPEYRVYFGTVAPPKVRLIDCDRAESSSVFRHLHGFK